MATPITWKNVPGNSSSSVDAAVQPYGILNSGLTSGFAQLSKVLDQYKKGEMGAAEDALMAQLGQYTTPEQMAQAQASGAIAGAINNRWVDAAEATKAIDARLSGLQTQARSAQEYSDFTDAVSARPHMEAISRMGVLGDIAGIEAYVAENSGVRGLGSHAQKVLNSIYDTQSAQANIANSRAQADLARMNVENHQRLLEEQAQRDNIALENFQESTRRRANRDLLNKTSQELAKQFGEYAIFDDNGIFDLQASEANVQRAFEENRLAYSLAHVDQNNWNRLRNGLNLSEQERIEQEKYLREKSESEMSLLDRQRRMMTGIPNLNGPSPRTINEWQGTIPELIDPVSLDEETKKYYNHLMSIAGPGTDTAANQAALTRATDGGIRMSVALDALSENPITSEDPAARGQDRVDLLTQEAITKSVEDEILAGDQTKILEGFINSASENGYIKDEPESVTKVAREALKLANKERTIIGPDGKAVTYFLPEEILNVVLKTMRTRALTIGRDNEFRKALEDWEKVNMDKIIKGAFDRKEILKQRNLEKNLKELGVSTLGK